MLSIKRKVLQCRAVARNSGIVFLNVDFVFFYCFYYGIKLDLYEQGNFTDYY